MTISFGATDTFQGRVGVGPFKTKYSLDGGVAYQNLDSPLAISSEGVHDIAFYSVDTFGNAELVRHLTLKIGAAEDPCSQGPAPAKDCDPEPPPYYVVVNSQQTCTNRNGSGCSPLVLGHPECTDCATCNVDVQSDVCEPYLTGVVSEGRTEVVYEMCQTGAGWRCRIRNFYSVGNCPIDDANPNWGTCKPEATGINLPAPVIVGGLSILGALFLAAGLVIRRRTSQARRFRTPFRPEAKRGSVCASFRPETLSAPHL